MVAGSGGGGTFLKTPCLRSMRYADSSNTIEKCCVYVGLLLHNRVDRFARRGKQNFLSKMKPVSTPIACRVPKLNLMFGLLLCVPFFVWRAPDI
jgi:hypothetical protein